MVRVVEERLRLGELLGAVEGESLEEERELDLLILLEDARSRVAFSAFCSLDTFGESLIRFGDEDLGEG